MPTKSEKAEYMRNWRSKNKRGEAARRKKYRDAHRLEIARYNRDYYQRHAYPWLYEDEDEEFC